MKIKDTAVITKIDNYYVLVDTSTNNDRFDGVIKLNETGKALCEFLSQDLDFNQLVDKMSELYDADRSQLEKDITKTIEALKEVKMIF